MPDFRELFEAVPGLYVVLRPDAARTIVAASTAYLHATMTEREAIVGRSLFEIFPDDPTGPTASGVRNLEASISRAIATRAPDTMALQRYDIRRPAKDGGGSEERWWCPQNSPVIGPDGEVRWIIHRVEDLTEYMRLEQTGAELESHTAQMEAEISARAQELQEVNATLRVSSDERSRFYEQAKIGEPLGTESFAMVSEELRTPLTLVLGPVERLLAKATDETLRHELEVIAHNARLLLRHVSDLLDMQKLEAAQTKLALDELRVRVDNLLAARRMMQSEAVTALVRSAVDGIITIDEHGIIRSFNPAAERMFGWGVYDVLGRNVSVLMPGLHREHHDGYLQRYFADDASHLIGVGRELEGVTRDGRTFPIHLAVSELTIGGLRMFAGFIRDMTAHKQLEEQLLHSQKMEAIGALTSGIAHDFGNLLMGITGCANIALAKLDPEHPIARYLRELSEAAKRGTGLTRQLMTFSRKQAPAVAIVHIDAVIEGCAGLLRRILGDDIELEIRPASRCTVLADAGQLEQLLVNLVVNARDAMPRGGRIMVTTEQIALDERGAEARGLPAAGDYVALTVTDTGTGMDEATRQRIFEPFFTTKEVGKGTGLGLATVYAIVKQFHGGITVQSELGHGTTFTMSFPCQVADAPATVTPLSTPQSLPRGHETVLIVDDDHLVRISVLHYLEGLGYRVVEASDPSDALRLSREPGAAYDLLLTDVMMPGIGGRSLAQRVRELIPQIGVLFMSAHPTEELLARGSLEPGDDVMHKPFGQGQLAVAVRRVLDAGDRPPPQPSTTAAKGRAKTILMVEDNSAAAMVVHELLSDEGYRVLPATTAAEALAIVEQAESLDLVLTDISLPDMLGTRLVERIRERLTETPVIYMSGYNQPNLAMGPNDRYLNKPFDFDDLLALVDVTLQRGRSR